MATKKKMLQAAAGQAGGAAGGGAIYVDDVFSTYLYEGTGATQTITNGIDLDGEGGLVWIKSRTSTRPHSFFDTERGVEKQLITYSTNPQNTRSGSLTAFNSDGFSLGTYADTNGTAYTPFASWTFRKAPKFFDVVTYTGDGVANRTVAHSLGVVPAVMIVKKISNLTSSFKRWLTYHRSLGATKSVLLDLSTAALTNSRWDNTEPTSSVFSVGSDINEDTETYVAYLFAHNDGDGEFGESGDQDIIKSGSYTGNGSGTGPEIDLGFEPQFFIIKRTDDTGDWVTSDIMRGIPTSASGVYDRAILAPNRSAAESFTDYYNVTPTGIAITSTDIAVNASGGTYIYIAIRRPHKPAESGTEVFAIDTQTGATTQPAFTSGFPVDMALRKDITSTNDWDLTGRLVQDTYLVPNSTAAEAAQTWRDFDFMDGHASTTVTNTNFYSWMFKRSPGFFDVVCYEGNSASYLTPTNISHNLGVAPEMMIIKCRSFGENWAVYHKDLGTLKYLVLDSNAAAATDTGHHWVDTAPTDSVFTIGHQDDVNSSGNTHIAYLFASLDGISKVGSYTGNGTSQTIDCGFSTGARFVLIKRSDSIANWVVLDTERGINASANDPFLALDATSAEGTTQDLLEPDSSGFAVTSNSNVNASGGTFIFYAIA